MAGSNEMAQYHGYEQTRDKVAIGYDGHNGNYLPTIQGKSIKEKSNHNNVANYYGCTSGATKHARSHGILINTM